MEKRRGASLYVYELGTTDILATGTTYARIGSRLATAAIYLQPW